MLRGLVAAAFLARKKKTDVLDVCLGIEDEVDIYRSFPLVSSGADVTLLPTLVGDSIVVGIVEFTRFQLCQRSLTKLHVPSEKPRLRLKSVDGFYAGKSGFWILRRSGSSIFE